MRFHRGAAIARAAWVHRFSHRHRRGEVPPAGGPGRDGESSRRLVVAEVEASVDGEVCATATQKYVLAPKE